jgi:PIN domain nuclease of toxin-antitoxin system
MRMPEPGLLLDTHCWLWLEFGESDRFTRAARGAVERAARAGQLCVSIISVWEIGLLESKGRLELNLSCAEWVEQALATPGLSLLPLTTQIALESSRLPGRCHGDPADRILLATARITGARFMTKDEKLLDYGRHQHAKVVPA